MGLGNVDITISTTGVSPKEVVEIYTGLNSITDGTTKIGVSEHMEIVNVYDKMWQEWVDATRLIGPPELKLNRRPAGANMAAIRKARKLRNSKRHKARK